MGHIRLYKPFIDKMSELLIRPKFKMYCIVLKQLSPIQKGVQAAHAIVEYGNLYFNEKEYQVWSKMDKTIVILNGRDSADIRNVMSQLDELGVLFATFEEESLDNLTTSVCFLCPDAIYNASSDIIKYNHIDVEKFRDVFINRHLAN